MIPTAAAMTMPGGKRFAIVGPSLFRTFRCLWMLEELGLPYEHIIARPHSRKVRQHHALGKVPLLLEYSTTDSEEQNPFVMYESSAINTYLGDLVNTDPSFSSCPSLVPPAGTHLRGTYDQTVSCIMTEMDAQGLWLHRKHEAMGEYFGYIPDAVAHAKVQFDKTNDHLAAQLTKNNDGPYLVGPTFTAADILYVHCLSWSKSISWDDYWKEKHPVLGDYLRLCQDRPAYQRVAAIRKREYELEKEKQTADKKKDSANQQSKI